MNDNFKFKGFHNCESCCGLEITHTDMGVVVVVTEVEDNKGTSVTNAAEVLFQAVCERFSLNPDEVIFIEHYSAGWMSNAEETFDLVYFSENNSTYTIWSRITLDHVRSIQKGENPIPAKELHALRKEAV